MLINHIAAHVLARRRSYRFHSWLLCIARTARVLLYPHAHRQLCSLPLFAGYVAQPGNDDLFHHLSHRHYLARHLNLDQRVRAVLTHYRTEDTLFDTFSPHSDQFTVRERIRFASPGVLEDRITSMDPKALVEPFTSVRTYRKVSPPNDELREFSCAEGLGSVK